MTYADMIPLKAFKNGKFNTLLYFPPKAIKESATSERQGCNSFFGSYTFSWNKGSSVRNFLLNEWHCFTCKILGNAYA